MPDYIKTPVSRMFGHPRAQGEDIAELKPIGGAPAWGPLISELLYGEEVNVLKLGAGWALVENVADRHTGYIDPDHIAVDGKVPTHVVTTPGSFFYQVADMKSPALGRLSFMSKVAVLDVDGDYARMPDGFLHCATLAPIEGFSMDPVEAARLFLGVPYKWGGRSSEGLDCSSLTQLAFAAAGVQLPKNAGPQRKVLSQDVDIGALEAGDLVFPRGHVMICSDGDHVIHADGMKGMRVREMKLQQALDERHVAVADVACKKRPTSGSPLDDLRRANPVDRAAFNGLTGPDIMS